MLDWVLNKSKNVLLKPWIYNAYAKIQALENSRKSRKVLSSNYKLFKS